MKLSFCLQSIQKYIIYSIVLSILLVAGALNKKVMAQENSYEVKSQTIKATIDAKGETRVRLYYQIEANYLNQLEIRIPIENQSLSSYRMGMIEKDQSINYFAETSSGVAGSYQLIQTPQEAKLNISYPVVDKTVEYVIEYDLQQSVINYQDGAYFEGSWIPLVDTAKERTNELQLVLSFAGQVEEEMIRYWLYGSGVEKYEFLNREGQTSLTLNLVIAQIKDKTSPVSLHTLFPKSVTPNNSNIIDIKGRQSIEARETQIQKDLTAQIKQKNYQSLVKIFLAVLFPLMGTFLLYRSYQLNKKNQKASVIEKTRLGMVPEPMDAYLVNAVVYNQAPGPNELAASLLELGRKGYLKILPVRMKNRSHSRIRSGFTLAFRLAEDPSIQTLLPSHERYVLQLISIDVKEGSVITLEEIITKIRQRKQNKKKYHDLWKKYTDAIEVKSVSADHLKAKNKNFSTLIAITVIFLTVLSAIGISYDLVNQQRSQWLIWVLLLLGSMLIVQAAFLFLLNKQRKQMNSTNQQQLVWNAYKKDLRNINQIDLTKYSTIDQWEKILIYAVCLDETATIQQAFTHHFDMKDLEKNSRSQNGDFYRVHGSVADILQPAIKEWIELIDPKGKWLRRFSEVD
ncbi:DUF2207 domain-containing protein [Facklamia sp. 7083-14-GEN3]|uniref:DUF2207 domain-containing protein n=1 Tax=Facklamia sp. 7083-14-GEN3 TaxID=2973478 RepID=UPI00215C6F95|nr:DUF2207 domain-containing protein [Facklamia sp. 7083-14-GEN3]MCR8969557.1 DUF2207 domain-containing protein [Facklamia sp. 7083-14-GEN3]